MPRKIFGKDDVGCWADGAGGGSHVREVLAGLVKALGGEGQDLAAELRNEPSDDLSEEDDAIELLNSFSHTGYDWGMMEGNLMFQSSKWWESEGD